MIRGKFFALSLFLAVSTLITCTSGAQKAEENIWELTKRGSNLSIQEAQDLEQKLLGNPNDLSTRSLLLVYYFRKSEAQMVEARQKHIMWIIENHPDSAIAGMPECSVNGI